MTPYIVGVTGSLGSGKSTVARYFKKLGAEVIDADSIAHQILTNKTIKKKVVFIFGKSCLSGRRISRKKLSKIVFSKRRKLNILCSIIHPPILKKIKHIIKRSKKRIVVIDAPLLIESGLYKKMDKIIAVTVNKKEVINRCIKLGFSKNQAKNRMRFQMSSKKKTRYADFIIDNSGEKMKTKKQVLEIWKKMEV